MSKSARERYNCASMQEQGQFLTTTLSEKEIGEILAKPHATLLAEAFEALAGELDTGGNTDEFLRLRQERGQKLIAYWQGKRREYQEALEAGIISERGKELVTGDERLVVMQLGVYERDDEEVLHIERRTKTEKDEISITASSSLGIDEFLSPPRISSEISTDPEEPADILYKVTFRRGRISTFERTIIHEDKENFARPYIKDTRVIDCSIFGVEIR